MALSRRFSSSSNAALSLDIGSPVFPRLIYRLALVVFDLYNFLSDLSINDKLDSDAEPNELLFAGYRSDGARNR